MASSGFSGDNGPATLAQLNADPTGLSVDGQGNLYIVDTNNNKVRKVTATAAGQAFPSTASGGTSTAQTVTVSNTGNQNLAATALSVTTDFAQAASGGTDCSSSTTLASGATCALALVFSPATPGARTGTASITDNTLNVAGNSPDGISFGNRQRHSNHNNCLGKSKQDYGQSVTMSANRNGDCRRSRSDDGAP